MSSIKSKNYELLFEYPENESKKWKEKIFELASKGDSKQFEQYIKSANGLYFRERKIIMAISEYTKNEISRYERIRLLKNLKKEKIASKIQINNSSVIIETNEMLIEFRKLSDAAIGLKEDKDLETEKRSGKCHLKSLEISKKLEISNYIVTGYVFGYSDKDKYLHSWVEYNSCGKEYVIDYTRNVIINKEAYYRLMNVIPLSRISNKVIEEDQNILLNLPELDRITLKEYLVFRDEIMRDLRLNKKIFEKEI